MWPSPIADGDKSGMTVSRFVTQQWLEHVSEQVDMYWETVTGGELGFEYESYSELWLWVDYGIVREVYPTLASLIGTRLRDVLTSALKEELIAAPEVFRGPEAPLFLALRSAGVGGAKALQATAS